jgi:YjjI family glycine radical enzyme
MSTAYEIVTDTTLTFHQQFINLAKLGENTDTTLPYNPEFLKAKEAGMICDLFEGALPFRPRYILPDYSILMKNGSKFLQLDPPKDIWEATSALMIMYRHVPSVSSFPVFLGNLDELLDPFIVDEQEATKAIGLLLLHIDRVLCDSFVHADIGPKDTKAGRIILKETLRLQTAVPNMTVRYDPELTSDEFGALCAEVMLSTAKPSFANHKMFSAEFGEKNYGLASCYNGLRLAGGGYTLPRLRLANIAKEATSVEHFKSVLLPKYVDLMTEFMDLRIRFMVEDSAFFKSNFLVKEGFIKQENFVGMFGLVGLAECVNTLMGIEDKKKGYGNNKNADDLGEEIIAHLDHLVSLHKAPYSENSADRYWLHAQVGIERDGLDSSPGARIPIGSEPEIHKQIAHSGRFHKYFPTGIGDIFRFEETWKNTPESLLDIIKGAMNAGMRYFSAYCENNDVVRVTGYLVKRSELEKLDRKEAVLNGATVLGQGSRDMAHALDRKVTK